MTFSPTARDGLWMQPGLWVGVAGAAAGVGVLLHWHAVDDQSFPLTVAAFPRLQGLGAYSAQERYTRLDVRRCPSAHSLAHQPRIPCTNLIETIPRT